LLAFVLRTVRVARTLADLDHPTKSPLDFARCEHIRDLTGPAGYPRYPRNPQNRNLGFASGTA
jgi:hypothetical protein